MKKFLLTCAFTLIGFEQGNAQAQTPITSPVIRSPTITSSPTASDGDWWVECPGDGFCYSKVKSGGVTYTIGRVSTGTPTNCCFTYVVTTQDTATTSASADTDITGLVFAVAANTRYFIDCVIPYSAAATSTGAGMTWTIPASPTLARMQATFQITGVGSSFITSGDTTASATVVSASVSTGATNIAHIKGIVSNGANAGNVQFRVRTEIEGSAITTLTGSVCRYQVY